MKRFLSLLLALAMLFSVCAVLTACDDSGSTSEESNKKSNKDKTHAFYGLTFSLNKAYKLQEESENYVVYSNGRYIIVIQRSENYDEYDARDLYKDCLEELEELEDEGEFKNVNHGENKDTYYVSFTNSDETMCQVVSFYAMDEYYWTVQVRNSEDNGEFDPEAMIKLITGWKYKETDEEEDDNDNEGPVQDTVPIATPNTNPVQRPSEPNKNATVGDLVMNLPESLRYIGGYGVYAEYENSAYSLRVSLVNDQYYESPYQLLDAHNLGNVDGYSEENGVPYGYYIDEYGFASVCAYYTKDGCGWTVFITNFNANEYNLYEMIDLVTCHYFE